MNERPLAAVACCWLFGASVPSLFPGYSQAVALAGAVLLLLGCGMAGRITGRLAFACVMALLLAYGEREWVSRAHRSDLSALWEKGAAPENAEIAGVVASVPDVDGDSVTFKLAADGMKEDSAREAVRIREKVRIRIRLEERKEQTIAAAWKRGDRLTIAGTPERPDDAGNFGAFDYRAYLEREGIRWQWVVQGTAGVRKIDKAVPWHLQPMRLVDELRSDIGKLMDRLYPHGDAGYMKGLVAGITEEVDPALYDAYSRLGLTHILAISGLHVGVVVFVLLRLGALLRLTRERSIDIAMAAMPAYMLITGASPSAVRACLMAMAALALARRNLLKDGLNLLAAAALAMAVWNPAIVENISFQLSFAVTAGLLLWTSAVSDLLSFIRFKSLRSALAVTITAQMVSLPLTLYYFHSVHLLSLPANLVLVPFVSFAVLPLGMASVVLGAAWHPLGIVPALLASVCNRWTFGLVEWLNQAASLSLIWPQPSKLWVGAAYGLIGCTLAAMRRRHVHRAHALDTEFAENETTVPLEAGMTKSGQAAIPMNAFLPHANGGAGAFPPSRVRAWTGRVTLLAMWTGWLLWGYQPTFLDPNGYVQFLDVGQGDGILIRTGQGKHVLVDAGGTVSFRKAGEEWRDRRDPFEIGKDLLVPLLKERGVRKLDALVLTHLDADHIGGAEAVLRHIPVRALIWNGTWKSSPAAERLFRAAESRGIPVYAARLGMRWDIDETASLDVLYPVGPPEADENARDRFGTLDRDGNAIAEEESSALLPELDRQNESSVVVLLTLYGRRFLLTGDVELPGEHGILQRLANEAAIGEQPLNRYSITAPVDVMKAAHHGSKTSSGPAWLAEWQPAEVVISVGRRNVYGHPHPAVVSRIESSGAALFRTDLHGEIRYRIRPSGIMHRQVKRG